VAGVIVLSTGMLSTWFDGDYAAMGFWSGMIYIVGMLIIWFVPRTAPVLQD
jgi:hypothetical protein